MVSPAPPTTKRLTTNLMPTSGNAEWLARSRAAVWHPCTQMKHHEKLPLVPIASGRGAWLYDFDGRRYLDGASSWWVNLFGHGHPKINAAIGAQLARLEHVMLAGFTHRPVVELSERLAALAPGRMGHCFYGSDGASAVEIALKMSSHYWRNAGKPQQDRLRASRSRAITARRSARCRSPTLRCFATPTRRCCGNRRAFRRRIRGWQQPALPRTRTRLPPLRSSKNTSLRTAKPLRH